MAIVSSVNSEKVLLLTLFLFQTCRRDTQSRREDGRNITYTSFLEFKARRRERSTKKQHGESETSSQSGGAFRLDCCRCLFVYFYFTLVLSLLSQVNFELLFSRNAICLVWFVVLFLRAHSGCMNINMSAANWQSSFERAREIELKQ